MHDRVTVVLVGIGGYGEMYVSALLDEPQGVQYQIVGVADPQPDNCSRLTELQSRGVPIYPALHDFYRHSAADLAVISSPIQMHAEHTCQALAQGSHVLVEKPAASVVADLDRMVAARDEMKLAVGVGFQWSFAPPILQLKRDIVAGRFGKPRTARCLTLWPRTETYYRRNDWAGRRRDSAGRWILDSPASNAMAHFLHNLLFLLGDRLDRSADPLSVTARLARVNDIETFDTIAAQVRTESGAVLLFLASHAVGEHEAVEPCFILEFEDATIDFAGALAPMTATCSDRSVVQYESPNATPQSTKLWTCLGAVTDAGDIPCGLEAARSHTLCIEAVERSGIQVHEFAGQRVRQIQTPNGTLRWVPGLAEELAGAYERGDLPDWGDLR